MSSLFSFAEKFLDDLDAKAESRLSLGGKDDGATPTAAVAAPTERYVSRRQREAKPAAASVAESPPVAAPAPVEVAPAAMAVAQRTPTPPEVDVSTTPPKPERVPTLDTPPSAVRRVSPEGSPPRAPSPPVAHAPAALTPPVPAVVPSTTPASVAGDAEAMAALREALAVKEQQLLDRTMAVDRLRRENKDLNAELDDLDARMVGTQGALDKSNREKELLEKQIRDAYTEAQDARMRADRLQGELDKTDTDVVSSITADLDDMKLKLEAAHTELDATRAEVLRVNDARETVLSEMSMLRAAAQRREEELLAENTELSASLANAEMQAAFAAGAEVTSTITAEAEAEAHVRREAATAAEGALLAERRQSSERQRQIDALKQQLSYAKDATTRLKAELAAVRAERQETVEKLSSELKACRAASPVDRSAQLETRVATLADSLVEKQGQLDRLASDKSALTQRLERERERRRLAEDALAKEKSAAGILASAGVEDELDVEGGGGRYGRRGGELRGRRRPLSISKITPLAKYPQAAQAADVLDKFCLRTGVFLSVNPLARLVFIVYLIILHMWTLFMLAFHTHHLEETGVLARSSGQPLLSPTGQPLT